MNEQEQDTRVEAMGDPHDSPTAESASADALQPPPPNQVSPLPLPWHQGPHYRFDIESAHGRVASGCPEFSPQADANAEYIVRACNSYPALMELLMHIRDDRSAYQWHDAIDDALTLAAVKKD